MLHGPSAGTMLWPDPEGGPAGLSVSLAGGDGINGDQAGDHRDGRAGTSEDGASWLAFLARFRQGTRGVDLVVAGTLHEGLRGAIAAVFGRSQLATVPFTIDFDDQPCSLGSPGLRPAMGSHHGAHHRLYQQRGYHPMLAIAQLDTGDRSTP